MILVNQKQLDLSALENDQHPMHRYAEEYKAGIKQLKNDFGEAIKFVRPGFTKTVKGIDQRGKEVNNMQELPAPMLAPLKARVTGKAGMEIWEYCEGSPELLPNGLWKATGKRSVSIGDSLTVNLNKDPELAFFLYFKSSVHRGKQIKIDDPAGEAKREGDAKRAELDLDTALYGVLGDEEQLKVMAQAYGISGVDKKHPDSLRKELRTAVLAGDKKRRSDPTSRGIKDFLEELKVTDSVRLRSLIMTNVDNGKIVWFGDGKFKIGERELCRVPQDALDRKQDFLCAHLLNVANRPKLQDLLRDIITKEYLDKQTDDKTFTWLAKVMGLQHNFKKSEEVKELVYSTFVVE
jgi:hypothetical protein